MTLNHLNAAHSLTINLYDALLGNMTKTRVVNIRLSEEEQATLSELSDRTGIAGGADIVRWALKQALRNTKSFAEPKPLDSEKGPNQ